MTGVDAGDTGEHDELLANASIASAVRVDGSTSGTQHLQRIGLAAREVLADLIGRGRLDHVVGHDAVVDQRRR